MAQYLVFSVYDRAAMTFGRPYFAPNQAVAVRSFESELKRDHPDNLLFLYPEQFDLYQIGSFEDVKGMLDSLSVPVHIQVGQGSNVFKEVRRVS